MLETVVRADTMLPGQYGAEGSRRDLSVPLASNPLDGAETKSGRECRESCRTDGGIGVSGKLAPLRKHLM
ncbi:hypothetical protein KSD_56890 [Ktedonobacter sp. SOSP1-85]|nr:hypothetical protein KSD_56890 [Ktedonobacter sp. SOSP1-85]